MLIRKLDSSSTLQYHIIYLIKYIIQFFYSRVSYYLPVLRIISSSSTLQYPIIYLY